MTGVAAIHQATLISVFSEEHTMCKAFWSAGVRNMKLSVEWWKTCRAVGLWQACLLVGILLLSGTGFAQLSTASLSGAVRDSSGAVIPNAKIVLRNVDTAVEHTTTSNNSGAYLFTDITPGRYTVRSSAQGFAEQQVPQFTLTVGQAATIDFALSVGSQTTVVTVQGATPQLESTTASLGTVIDTKQVNDLPLNGRDFTQLLVLTPGMSTVNNSQSGTSQHNYAEPEPSNQYSTIPSVNGMGNRSNYFFTDGLSNFGSFHSVYAVPPIIDEIQEFKVVSHPDTAEYGSVTGGVVNVVTKSGTNDLHGSAFEYARNGIFDGQKPFTQSRPDFTENEFGGVLGGPVLLPKLYNGRKHKTFFFGAYQGFRYSLVEANAIRVPTPAELSGDLSDWPTQIYNPFTTTYDSTTQTFVRQPFAGNKITPDPNIVAYAKFIFPAGGPAFDSNGHNATDSTPDTQNINQWTARIDEKIGDNDSVWFRYSSDTSSETNSGGVPGLPQTVQIPNRNYGGSYVHVFSPSLVLQAAFGRTEVGDNVYEQYTASSTGIISQVGFSPAFVGNWVAYPGASFLPSPGINGTAVGGSQYANPNPGYALHPDVPNANQYSGMLTKTIGNQTLTLGGGYITNKFYAPITTDGLGFGASQTANINANDPLSAVDTGDPMASFLLNVPSSADRRNAVTETRPGGVMSEFLQDSWRVTGRLTINMGVRYDLTFIPPVGPNKLIGVSGGPETGNMDFNTGNYVIQKLPPPCSVRGYSPCIPGNGTLPANVVVSPNDKLMHNTPTNVGPHFGFALRVKNNLVVHAAAGIVYDNWSGMLQLAQNLDGGWPDIGTLEAGNLNTPTATNPTPTVTAQNPFGATAASANFPAPNPYALGNYDADPNMKTPYSEQWNFGVQQLLSASTTLTLNYVGSSMHRMDVGGNYNVAAYPDPTASITSRQPFPMFQSTPYDRSWGSGNYNGLQASVERRFTNGFSYAVAYTFSKSIDVGGDGYFGVEGGVPQNEYDPAQYDRSVSGLDLTHILAVNTLYQVPFGKGAKFSTGNGALDYILGNWQFNDLFQAHSGIAFTPCITSDIANIGQQSWMCYEHLNVVPGVNPNLSHRSAAAWFNTAAFAVPAAGTFGNAGRNSLRGPAFWDLDMSLFREFPVREERTIEFRAEAFNMLNHPYLGQPSNDWNAGTAFGTIGSVQNLPRQLQLAVKFLF